MQYVALLRGITPSNPNMRGEKLKEVFESLGLKNVHTVIGSGNVVFESGKTTISLLEEEIEKELKKKLDINSKTIIRSRKEIENLVKKNPFKGIKDEKPNYLIVTFFKDRKEELCSIVNLSEGKTPDFMNKIERQYGKDITTRTWKTVNRIFTKMAMV